MSLAYELVAAGRCSGNCMVACSSRTSCSCVCDGAYHGMLADADLGAEVVLATSVRAKSRAGSGVVDSARWLAGFLATAGAAPSAVIKSHAREAGISERTLHRARTYLGLDVKYTNDSPPTTVWRMPEYRPKAS